jgi:predicted transcriptional regulator
MTHPLRRWRERHGLLQSEAGPLIGVSQQDWARYERGLVLPRREVFRRMIEVTGISACRIVKAWLYPRSEGAAK